MVEVWGRGFGRSKKDRSILGKYIRASVFKNTEEKIALFNESNDVDVRRQIIEELCFCSFNFLPYGLGVIFQENSLAIRYAKVFGNRITYVFIPENDALVVKKYSSSNKAHLFYCRVHILVISLVLDENGDIVINRCSLNKDLS